MHYFLVFQLGNFWELRPYIIYKIYLEKLSLKFMENNKRVKKILETKIMKIKY